MSIWLATREEVKGAADIAETAYMNSRIDRALEGGTEDVEKLCHRVFYPTLATCYFDWPDPQQGTSFRLWLNQHEVDSVTEVTSGGVVIPSSDYLLYPQSGPPYNRLEINVSSSSALGGGSTHQQDIGITGVYIGCAVKEDPAGTLAAAISSTTATTVDVTDSGAIGVGQLVRLGSERMVVTGKSMLTTGQTLQTPMTADTSNTTCVVADGSTFAVGEVILLNAEKMLIEDIADDTLIVRRMYDGSVLAEHTGSTIYARRRLTVERGVLGTTAAEHSLGAAIVKHRFPAAARRMAIAEAQNTLAQESAQWARQIGSGENAREAFAKGLRDARDQCYNALGRKARMRVVAG